MEDIGGLQKYLDSLPAEEKIIRKKAFRSLIKGRSLSVSSIIESLAFSKGKVHKLIGCLSEKGVIVFDSEAQAVVGSGGLSLVPTPHQLQVEDLRKSLFHTIDQMHYQVRLLYQKCCFPKGPGSSVQPSPHRRQC